ncbi:hypothetical protein [Vannielia sp. SX4]|uniref:hypothetical protein n=1 Tax=Vannielia sp. SX4 TaxID=3463852 RepID=UPI004059EF7C
MAISSHQIRACFEAALAIRGGQAGISAARARVARETGMGAGSAQDYIYITLRLLDGRSYTRTMNAEGTRLLLDWIGDDFGDAQQKAAAELVLAHVDYYRSLPRGGPQVGVRDAAHSVLRALATREEA